MPVSASLLTPGRNRVWEAPGQLHWKCVGAEIPGTERGLIVAEGSARDASIPWYYFEENAAETQVDDSEKWNAS
jgi:hypothetical protein